MQFEVETKNLPATLEGLEGFTGYESFPDESWVIPRTKVVQPTSKEGTPGNFRNNLTGLETETINAVLIKVEPGRVWWNKDDPGSELPLCRSYDGWDPDPAIENPPSDHCCIPKIVGGKKMKTDVCPQAAWGSDHTPPVCGETFSLLFIDLDDLLPFWLVASSTSIGAVKKYVSSIGLRKRKLPEFKTVLSLEEERKKGRYFVLKFAPAVPLTPDDVTKLNDLVQTYRTETVKRTFDAEMSTKDVATDGDTMDAATGKTTAEVPDWMKKEMDAEKEANQKNGKK